MDARKYHRTYHLPWSEGVTNSDKVVQNDSHFEGKCKENFVQSDEHWMHKQVVKNELEQP